MAANSPENQERARMNTEEHSISELIRQGESLSVEFKSDRKGLPDKDLVETVVSLANAEGGDLLLGVEDDGEVTGLHEKRESVAGLQALIVNRILPSISVNVDSVETQERTIARIRVPKSQQLVCTSGGKYLQRRIKHDGTPETVPMPPSEVTQRQSALELLDFSAMPVEAVTAVQLDPIQRLRIRRAIEQYAGDRKLLELSDDELDGALRLTCVVNGASHPTVAGLLLLGTEDILRQHLPTYEVAFQVLQGTDVKVNDFFHRPLLETFEAVELLFRARVEEEEIQVGLFRVPAPNYDRTAFREAFVNALVHRDFSKLGAIHVQLNGDGLSISNPGGFVAGVHQNNLLVTPPKPRNPLLADIVKRIGLAERTGRGIDLIYQGMLRYGRPAPDYSYSDEFNVVLRMSNAAADLDFLRMVVEQSDKFDSTSIDSLVILSRLREERRLAIAELATSVQKPEGNVRSTVERLVETGLLEPHGIGRGRTYTLSPTLYRKVGRKGEYVRQAGFSSIQHGQMVLNYIDAHGSIKRADVMDLCHITGPQAYYLLKRMGEKGEIVKVGERRQAAYKRNV